MNLRRAYIALFIIFLLALFFRTFRLGSFPKYLHQDEIMNGYVGRYILQNGKDLYGNKYPLLYFNNFGDYPNVIPMYISGLSTYVLGLNSFAIRFPIALMGSLAVFPFFFICQQIWRQTRISLLCSFLLAILPWHIVLSRATSENIMATTVFLCGLSLLLTSLRTKKTKYLVWVFLLYTASYFLYPACRLLVPLSLLPVPFLVITKGRIRLYLLTMLFSFFILTFGISSTTWGRARFAQTSVLTFNNQVKNLAVNFTYSAPKEFYLTTRLFNNKYVLAGREILTQYFTYISPNFLFMHGGHPDRYLVPQQGLMYLSCFLILVGALTLPTFTKKTKLPPLPLNIPLMLYLIWITLLTPLSAALTLDEVPNVHRSAMLGVFLLFLVGASLLRLWKVNLGKIPILYFIYVLLFLETGYFIHQYFAQSPSAQARARYNERTILIKKLIQDRDNYETIIVPREIFAIYYLFYTQNFDPELAGKFGMNLYLPNIDKMHFIDDDCPSLQSPLPNMGRVLLVDKSQCSSSQAFITTELVTHEDKIPAYKLMRPVSQAPKTLLTQ